MDRDILNVIHSEVEAGGFGVLCTVTEESGSTPRSKGASMWVRIDGSISGTIGGGLIEFEAINKAKELLNSGESMLVWKKDLTERNGMLCGGAATIYMEVIGREDELVIFGGGHVGKAVAEVGAFVGFRVTIWDERKEFANKENIPCARSVVCPIDDIYNNGIDLHDRSYVVIMTRGHSLDAEAVAITDKMPGAYYGMIGSRSKIESIRKTLLARGVSQEHLDRIHQPIGLPIKAETPEEIAVSILAEMIAVRRGGDLAGLRKANLSD
ncbi:MAG: xanthine dehydrogenase [Synergistaceae bacterium]|nr:xanthine dehydrogenase [Synergistaceae bacterium]